jgi:hypothetical protein
VIRNAIIHLQGKLPVLADLRAAPTALDHGLLCTNLRTRDGKRPSFIDDPQAWFLIPIHEVTILELPVGSLEATVDAPAAANGHAEDLRVVMLGAGDDPGGADPLEPDEDLLARIRQL